MAQSLPCLTREQVRFVDRYAIENLGIPGVVLMENAGRGCVDLLMQQSGDGPVLILCGPGNNGGDGWVMARHLQIHGRKVAVALFCDPRKYQGDAQLNWKIAQNLEIPTVQLSSEGSIEAWLGQLQTVFSGQAVEWVVDALLGTGAVGPLRGAFPTVIQTANRLDCRRMAIDLPSGLDAEQGVVQRPIFKADLTATFVAAKPGLLTVESEPWVGQLHVLDIGLPPAAIHRAVQFMAENDDAGRSQR